MTLNRTTHETLLIAILKDIFTNTSLAPFLAFKGGTAAMLFYGLNRFSVDLNFDLIHNNEDAVFTKIKEILSTYGTVKGEKKRYSLIFLLSYSGKLENAQNIKVEINKRNFGSRYKVMQHLGISMPVMIQEDMLANKLVAMYERLGKTNRDIYDVWFFLQNRWPVNKQIVEMRTGMSYKAFLQTCIEALEKMSNQSILSGLGELLTAEQKTWVKAKLLAETLFLLKLASHSEQ